MGPTCPLGWEGSSKEVTSKPRAEGDAVRVPEVRRPLAEDCVALPGSGRSPRALGSLPGMGGPKVQVQNEAGPSRAGLVLMRLLGWRPAACRRGGRTAFWTGWTGTRLTGEVVGLGVMAEVGMWEESGRN